LRVFISIDFPEEIISEIIKIQKNLPFFEGKKIEKNNLHLTLKFLGEVDNKSLERIKTNLKTVFYSPFKVKLGEVGFFSKSLIRIIWVRVFNCESLQEQIDSSLESLFRKEKRFMGHLTIARVKRINNKKEFITNLEKIPILNKEFTVNNFKLFKSELGENGPIYTLLEEYPLKIKTDY
jgi:2'-5' RNA ligase